jgi:competence protein ComEC
MNLLIFKLFCLVFFVWVSISVVNQWPDDYSHIIFCDVGQGDSILITHKDQQILVDGGPDEKVISCLEENMPFWDKSIDFLVITHMDEDHIGGLPSVLSRYSVNTILKNISSKETAVFEAIEASVSRKSLKGASISTSYLGQQFMLGDSIKSIIISPQTGYTETTLSDGSHIFEQKIDEKNSENDLSIGIFVEFDDVKLLLTGDIEKPGELAVIESGMTEPTNIIKVGHHGSKSSSTRQFISIFRPEVAVISSGKNNQYNHPFPQVIELFDEFGVDIYRTDSQETIEFVTDGISYWKAI